MKPARIGLVLSFCHLFQVRGLGSKPGEMEFNYLMVIPLNGDKIAVSTLLNCSWGDFEHFYFEIRKQNIVREIFIQKLNSSFVF